MPSLNHTHTYRRRHQSKDIYICSDPHCSHHQDRKYLNGKASICPSCRREYVLTFRDLKKENPTCQLCVKNKGRVKALDILNEIFTEAPDPTNLTTANDETTKEEN